MSEPETTPATENESYERPTATALDPVLGQAFRVLDDGFVRVVDYMGSDESIVQAARVSYGRGTKKVHEDRGLIRYLIRHRHTTPFEMCEIKLHVRVPMDCWRQWIRHRTANVNEYSTRYSEAIDSSQTTPPDEWRLQASGNRQGSEGCLEPALGARLSERERALQDEARAVYQDRLSMGVAREQARKDLPLSTYTEAYWKIDLHNLLHFLALRMDPHAQEEIRAYARIIGEEILARWCPLTWEAFVDYRSEALSLTRLEIAVLAPVAAGDRDGAMAVARSFGWLEEGRNGWKRNRERSEFEEKLARLGLTAPWMRGADS
ncbi:MAG: FAD-dependent thymidylate synthase [Candidatus Eisenbacteria bacterium]|uniref:Flavin-dependent thymidylate synthase n=1 Tax=Eiseniibacteriota bacterium TaxID=2212470 RepID=A0A956RQ77_UNCEI|nr:FAD-dependent thymidylate synthase [Candidatus Eisenbacteria bacterium]